MKKKLIYTIVGIIVIVALGIFALNLKKGSNVTPETSLIDFAIDDTAQVTKIKVYSSFKDQSYTLTRNDKGVWEGPDHQCIQQGIANMMLKTFKDVTLKGYVAKSAMENTKRLLMAQYKKVDIYKNGQWAKTWYVGQGTKDHLGTYMLLVTHKQESGSSIKRWFCDVLPFLNCTPDKIKSDYPVIMGMKGFYGILSPRFKSDYRQYICTDLFSFPSEKIKQIKVTNRVNTSKSFIVDVHSPDNITVHSNGSLLENINQTNLQFYLNGFKNIHFNQPNYTMSKERIDSMKQLPPAYEINIQGEQKSYHLDLYRRPDPGVRQPQDSIIYDQTYLWAITPQGKMVRMQYYVVGPLIEGKTIFVDDKQASLKEK